MEQTYTQLHSHLIFAIQDINNFLPKDQLPTLERCLSGIIKKLNHKPLHISCQKDHSHLFIGWNPDQSLAEIVSKTKTAATSFIKKQDWGVPNFSWQKGYGGFSYSHDHIDALIKYLLNQNRYHEKHTFKKEYLMTLEKFAIPYDDRYVFEFYD